MISAAYKKNNLLLLHISNRMKYQRSLSSFFWCILTDVTEKAETNNPTFLAWIDEVVRTFEASVRQKIFSKTFAVLILQLIFTGKLQYLHTCNIGFTIICTVVNCKFI